ncbi:MAG: hypothetical protein H6Q15_289 [Bacteroidetes bacterium]|nr:hypothetical protein [Bacteroidota bacterium]
MTDKEKIEKLVSMEVEDKINDHSAVTVNISIREIMAAKGFSEDRIEEFIQIFQEEIARLIVTDREKFDDFIRELSGMDKDCRVDIVKDDC